MRGWIKCWRPKVWMNCVRTIPVLKSSVRTEHEHARLVVRTIHRSRLREWMKGKLKLNGIETLVSAPQIPDCRRRVGRTSI
jgi:hypothetical protein